MFLGEKPYQVTRLDSPGNKPCTEGRLGKDSKPLPGLLLLPGSLGARRGSPVGWGVHTPTALPATPVLSEDEGARAEAGGGEAGLPHSTSNATLDVTSGRGQLCELSVTSCEPIISSKYTV